MNKTNRTLTVTQLLQQSAQPQQKPSAAVAKSSTYAVSTRRAQQIEHLYGPLRQLLATFTPTRQRDFTRSVLECSFGPAPTLRELDAVYGRDRAVLWLIPQLFDLSEMCGCAKKLSQQQLEYCAQRIADGFGHYRLTEIMLYFQALKDGRFGHFYGAIDPQLILEALRSKFPAYLGDRIHREECQQAREAARAEARRLTARPLPAAAPPAGNGPVDKGLEKNEPASNAAVGHGFEKNASAGNGWVSKGPADSGPAAPGAVHSPSAGSRPMATRPQPSSV